MSQQHERRGRWQAGRSRELVRLCEDGLGACLQVARAGHGAAVGVEAHRAADALESGSVGGVLLLWRDEPPATTARPRHQMQPPMLRHKHATPPHPHMTLPWECDEARCWR